MKKLWVKYFGILVVLVLAACSSSSSNNLNDESLEEIPKGTVVAQFGQLKVLNGQIVGENNMPIQLRGMSFFWSQWIGKYYTPGTVNWLKNDWEVTVIRAAMAVEDDGGYLSNPEINKERVFTVVDAAIDAGIYVIIDWHSHFSLDKEEEAKAFFAEVARKYKDIPNVIFETYNEPINDSWSALKKYHEAVIGAIRAEGNTNLVICGTRTWSQRVDEVVNNEVNDNNVAYTLHYYAATHKKELRAIAQKALDANIPIFVTEFGVTEATGDGFVDAEEAAIWWKFLDDNSISWCNWSIADKEESSASLKPNSSINGGWSESDLTESGKLVRTELKAKNPKFE